MRSTVSRPLSELVPDGRLVAIAAVTALVASLALALSTPATISIDGQRIASDVSPVTTPDGAAYLPLRAVAEAAGAQADFDVPTGQIVVRRGTDVLVMHAGSTAARLGMRPGDRRDRLRLDRPLRRHAHPRRDPHSGRGGRRRRRRRTVAAATGGRCNACGEPASASHR